MRANETNAKVPRIACREFGYFGVQIGCKRRYYFVHSFAALAELNQPLKPTDDVAPDYKTQTGALSSGQPLRQSTRGDPTTLSDYLSTLYPHY
jgi:hypothetical protein